MHTTATSDSHVFLHCMHLKVISQCRLRGSEGERLRGGILGLGLLMGGAVFSYGYSRGCRKAEILAIKDDGKPIRSCTMFPVCMNGHLVFARRVECPRSDASLIFGELNHLPTITSCSLCHEDQSKQLMTQSEGCKAVVT